MNPNPTHKWQKGESGNLKGRPEGMTLKEYARLKFIAMSPEAKDKFLERLSPIDFFKMAEGNPAQDLTSGGEKIQTIPIYGAKSGEVIQGHDSNQENIQPQE